MNLVLKPSLPETELQLMSRTGKNSSLSDADSGQFGHEGRTLMSVRGISKSFGGQTILKNISFNVSAGQVILLQGANGSGKTTLVNILTGYLQPDHGEIQFHENGNAECFRFPRRWWQQLNPWDHFLPERVASNRIGRSWQDVRLFSTLSLEDNIVVAAPEVPEEGLLRVLFQRNRAKRSLAKMRETAKNLLATLGLDDRSSSSADKISLGQTKRVAIARSVHAGARVLFLDEPLSGLDKKGVENVLALLKALVAKQHLTLVVVEHAWNMNHVKPLADILWTMEDGQIRTERVNKNKIRASQREPLYSNIANLFPGFVLVETRTLYSGALLELYRPEKATSETEVILEVRDAVIYRGKRLVIGSPVEEKELTNGLSFQIRAGDLVILRAPNGWGKTTLLDALSGITRVVQGEVIYRDARIDHIPAWERSRKGLRYIRANNGDYNSLTVGEVSELISPGSSDTRIGTGKLFASLSGGQKKMIQLELINNVRDGLILMDEPFGSLDVRNIKNIVADTRRFLVESQQGAVLLALPTGIST